MRMQGLVIQVVWLMPHRLAHTRPVHAEYNRNVRTTKTVTRCNK